MVAWAAGVGVWAAAAAAAGVEQGCWRRSRFCVLCLGPAAAVVAQTEDGAEVAAHLAEQGISGSRGAVGQLGL